MHAGPSRQVPEQSEGDEYADMVGGPAAAAADNPHDTLANCRTTARQEVHLPPSLPLHCVSAVVHCSIDFLTSDSRCMPDDLESAMFVPATYILLPLVVDCHSSQLQK